MIPQRFKKKKKIVFGEEEFIIEVQEKISGI